MNTSRSQRPRISRDGLLVVTEPTGEGLACVLTECGNPECECRELLIDALPFGSWVREVTLNDGKLVFKGARPDELSPADTPRLALRLDVDQGCLLEDDGRPIDVSAHPRLAVLEEAIDADLLDEMARLWLRGKGQVIAEGDRYPDVKVRRWRPGEMVRWDEVFQTVRADVYLLKGTTYVAFDMYCPDPKCSCKDAAVDFLGRRRRVGTAKVRLDSGQVKLDPARGKDERILRTLWERYLGRHHGTGHLRPRDREMKKFGSEKLFARPAAPVQRTKSKVGRNAPCPCGSGKKYKRCCLGKTA